MDSANDRSQKKTDPPLEVFSIGEVNGLSEISEGNDASETFLTPIIEVGKRYPATMIYQKVVNKALTLVLACHRSTLGTGFTFK
jgi:hypothetical protein